jgi:hypothetical protein
MSLKCVYRLWSVLVNPWYFKILDLKGANALFCYAIHKITIWTFCTAEADSVYTIMEYTETSTSKLNETEILITYSH